MGDNITQEQKKIFADNLNRLLEERNKNQMDLANYFKLTPSTVSDWCTAKKYPRVDNMQKLADYFGVRKSDLTEKQEPIDIGKQALLDNYNKLNKSAQNTLIKYSKFMASQPENLKNNPQTNKMNA